MIGAGRHATKSHHHQGVDRLGDGLAVGARSALATISSRRSRCRELGFVLGVQWHPEADPGSPVIGGLVEAARAHALTRAAAL